MSFSSSSTAEQHSFHDCPLRSSSLLIVNTDKQTIITATDEVFDLLDYAPTHLVGKSIHVLNPTLHRRRSASKGNKEDKREEHFTLLHESLGQIPFDICVHHDPLTNATDLDYWLIRPIHNNNGIIQQPQNKTTEGGATILRLSPFGTIEHAYPSKHFPQQIHQLKGHPIMSFVHESDVRSLCEKLANIKRKKAYLTFSVRWLNKHHPKQLVADQEEEEEEEDTYDWVSFTVMNSQRNKRYSYDAANDPQSRPICIIRSTTAPPSQQQHTLQHSTRRQQECSSSNSTYLVPYLLTGLVSGTVKLLWEGTSLGVNSFLDLMEAMHTALDQGKVYLIEYLAHLLTHAVKMMHEVVYVTTWEEDEQGTTSSSSSSSSSSGSDYYSEEDVVEYMDMNAGVKKRKNRKKRCHQKVEEKTKEQLYDGLSSIRVSIDDDSIWSVPLLVGKTIMQKHNKKKNLTVTTTNRLCNNNNKHTN